VKVQPKVEGKMTERLNMPVIVGAIPLFNVTSFVLNEGYKAVSIAGSWLKQMVAPTTKTINIEALLIREERALRPVLEAAALASRALASAVGMTMQITGIPVVAKNGVHLDMQITSLAFTQDNQMRDTLKVSMSLTHVPRSSITAAIGAGADLAVAAATPFI
jgi:hypothetical protein